MAIDEKLPAYGLRLRRSNGNLNNNDILSGL